MHYLLVIAVVAILLYAPQLWVRCAITWNRPSEPSSCSPQATSDSGASRATKGSRIMFDTSLATDLGANKGAARPVAS